MRRVTWTWVPVLATATVRRSTLGRSAARPAPKLSALSTEFQHPDLSFDHCLLRSSPSFNRLGLFLSCDLLLYHIIMPLSFRIIYGTIDNLKINDHK